jgi:excisionase family DNA binding protein
MSQLAALDRRNAVSMSGQVESRYFGDRRLLSRDQVAEFLGASISTVVRLERRGDLPHVKLGRLVRFRPGDVEALIERAYAGNPANDESPAGIPGFVSSSAGQGRHDSP